MSERTDWFLDIQETSSSGAKYKKTLTVAKVAPGSPAEALGLASGDFFVSINGMPALTAEVSDILLANDTATYVFVRHADDMQVTVKTPSLPMGIRTEATSDDIVLSYKSKPLHDLDGILMLWEREDYGRIRQIAKNATSKGMMGKLGLSKTKNVLADVLTAICDVEAGKGQGAYQVISSFDKEHGNRIRSDLAGLVGYYLARQHREAGDRRMYENVMHRIMEFPDNQESPRIKAEADANNFSYVSESRRLGQRFSPVAEMEFLEGGTGSGLVADIVKNIQPGQIMPFSLMLTYRGNGPYNSALKAYHTIFPFLKDVMQPMVVLTSVRDKPADHPEYFEGEEALVADGTPITIFYDKLAYWADLIKAGAPEYLVIDNQTKIVWEDDLYDDYAYWEMLAALEAAENE